MLSFWKIAPPSLQHQLPYRKHFVFFWEACVSGVGGNRILPTWCLSLTEFVTRNISCCFFTKLFLKRDFLILVKTGGRVSFLSSPPVSLLKLVLSPCLFRIIFLFVSYSDSFLSMVPLSSKICGKLFLWLLAGRPFVVCIVLHIQ